MAGLEGQDHGRNPGCWRAVGDGMDCVAADPGIRVINQLEQPRPYALVIGLDVTGAQVLARELAGPAVLAPGQFQKSVELIPGRAPVVGRQAEPYSRGDSVPSSHHHDGSAGRSGRASDYVPGLGTTGREWAIT